MVPNAKESFKDTLYYNSADEASLLRDPYHPPTPKQQSQEQGPGNVACKQHPTLTLHPGDTVSPEHIVPTPFP